MTSRNDSERAHVVVDRYQWNPCQNGPVVALVDEAEVLVKGHIPVPDSFGRLALEQEMTPADHMVHHEVVHACLKHGAKRSIQRHEALSIRLQRTALESHIRVGQRLEAQPPKRPALAIGEERNDDVTVSTESILK
jgi:hypothetical protein